MGSLFSRQENKMAKTIAQIIEALEVIKEIAEESLDHAIDAEYPNDEKIEALEAKVEALEAALDALREWE